MMVHDGFLSYDWSGKGVFHHGNHWSMHQLKAALLQDSNMVVPGKHLNGLVVGNKHEAMATSIMDTMGM